MLAIRRVDMFGLGADEAGVPLPAQASKTVIMPAVPDNTTVRCTFDPAINGMRCSPVGLFEAPTIFLLGAGAAFLLALGYAFGRTRFLPRFVERVANNPPI